MTTAIEKEFNAVSEKYDRQRKFLIPCFEDFYNMALELSEQVEDVTKILDVGAGTGLVSAFFHDKYRDASITLVDVSEDMLQKAKNRFSDIDNIEYLLADFSEADFGVGVYDLVVSGLAIHHLEDDQKQMLFNKIYRALKPGGMFINADQVLGQTPAIDKIYKQAWIDKVEASIGLTREEKQQAYKRVQLDIMAPLQDQLLWLSNAGFKEANSYYQYYNFVVFAGKK